MVSSKFGNVTVEFGPGTVIDAPPVKKVGKDAIQVDSKVAVKLEKPDGEPPPNGDPPPNGEVLDGEPVPNGEPPPNGDPPPVEEPPAPSFRTAVARRIVVRPGKLQCVQQKGVFQGKGKGKVKLLDEDGNIEDLDADEPPPDGDPPRDGDPPPDGEPPPEGDQPPEEGDDVTLLVCKGKVLDTLRAEKIAERLARFEVKLAERGEKLAAKLTALQQKRDEKLLARLEKTVKNAPLDAKGNAEKAHGKAKEDKDKGPPDKDKEPPGKGKK